MGGKVFKHKKICKIYTKNIKDILSIISKKTSICINDLHIVGSGSLNNSTIINDLDVVIDQTKYNKHQTTHHFINIFGLDNVKVNNGTNICSIALQYNNIIQIDFIFSQHVKWSKFAFCQYSKNNTTQYKTVIRTLLLSGIVTLIHQQNIDYFKFENNQLTIRIGRTFDLIKGIRRICQYKTRNNKKLKTITLQQMLQLHPNINIYQHELNIVDPYQALQIMFPASKKPLYPRDVETTEQLLKLIPQNFNINQQQKIYQRALSRIPTNILLPKQIQTLI